MDLEEQLGNFLANKPTLHKGVWVAPGAVVVGHVTIGEGSSVWFNAVVRADFNRIVIGRHTNIQDNCVIHVSDEYGCVLGNHVTVGHGARVHACTVHDRVLVGMGSTVLDGAVVGEAALIGANSLVPMGMEIPPGWLALGVPARLVRELKPEEQSVIYGYSEKYVRTAEYYRENVILGR